MTHCWQLCIDVIQTVVLSLRSVSRICWEKKGKNILFIRQIQYHTHEQLCYNVNSWTKFSSTFGCCKSIWMSVLPFQTLGIRAALFSFTWHLHTSSGAVVFNLWCVSYPNQVKQVVQQSDGVKNVRSFHKTKTNKLVITNISSFMITQKLSTVHDKWL